MVCGHIETQTNKTIDLLWLKVKIICGGLRTDVRGAELEGYCNCEGASPPYSENPPLFGRSMNGPGLMDQNINLAR